MSIISEQIKFDCVVNEKLKIHIHKYLNFYFELNPDYKIGIDHHLHPIIKESGLILYFIDKPCYRLRFLWINTKGYIFRPNCTIPIGNIYKGEYCFNNGMPSLYYSYEILDKIKAFLYDHKLKFRNNRRELKRNKLGNNKEDIIVMKSPIKWLYDILKNEKYEQNFTNMTTVEHQYKNYREWCLCENIEPTSKINWMRQLSGFGIKNNLMIVKPKVVKINKKCVKMFNISSEIVCKDIYRFFYGDYIFTN